MKNNKLVTIEEAKSLVSNLGYSNVELSNFGRNNWVFLSKDDCISIPKDNSKIQYSVRASAMKFLSQNEIPTTSLINYGILEGREYIITKRLDATNLNILKLSSKEQDKIHIQCGELAYKLHQLRVEGFGRLDSLLKGPYESWKEFVQIYFNSALERLHSTQDLKEKFSQKLQRNFSTYEHLLDSCKGSFLHGDYHLDNMLFEGTNLKALIDLDIVMSGDIYWDLGHYTRTFKGDRDRGRKAFFEGYGEFDEDRSRFYAMIIWTRKVASQGESRVESLRESVPEMEKILK